MKSTYKSRLRLRTLAPLAAVAFAGVSGCSGVESEPTPADQGSVAPGQQAVGEYILHVQPGKKKITAHRLTTAALDLEKAQPGLRPQAMIDAVLTQDGVPGSNNGVTNNNTVELVTGTVEDTFGTAATANCPADGFCAQVTLNSFWTKALNFTYTQVTAIVDASGTTMTGHSATNSDDPNRTGLDATFGLWLYQSPSIDTTHGSFPASGGGYGTGAQGVMLPGVANGATKWWKFANPDDADTYIRLKVWAATAYTNYALTTLTYRSGNPAFMDACALGAGETGLPIKLNSDDSTLATSPVLATSAQLIYVGLPFGFTFYGNTYSGTTGRVNFSKFGNFTLSNGKATGTEVASSGNNANLPATSAPRPSMSPWWDATVLGSGASGECAKLVGSAPNRQLVVTLKRIAFTGNGTSGPFVTYGVVLNESTEEIWFNYIAPTGGPGTAWSATYGAQNAAGNLAASGTVNTTTLFPSAAPGRIVLQPIP